MKTSAVLLLFTITLFLPSLSFGAFCRYYRSSNRVTCGSVTCDTASPNDQSDKLPSGYYYVGNFYYRNGVPWFNLYRQRSRSNDFWDYYTQVPELGCRGGFGLHAGSFSLGCITVTSDSCFRRLQSQITGNYDVTYFDAKECRGCNTYGCVYTTSVRRPRTTDLQSY